MKRIFLTTFTNLISVVCFSQRGVTERSYETVGLLNGDQILDSLKIAIPLIVVGFLIANNFVWSKKDTDKIDETSTKIGCFGIIIMAGGVFFLLPLLSWVEFIFVNLMYLGIAIFVVGFILYTIISTITKK
jgi:predicted membrane channel-forming protein YqfA (hemolysin III family)